MELRCLLFTSDEGTAGAVRQTLSDLGVEAEHCAVAVEAVQKVTNNPFNLLIVDWDSHSEAAFLLKTARERKASERPLTVAIVSRDLYVTQALQAGANSIVRKPIVVDQLRESLTSACNLVRSRKEASIAAAASTASANGALSTGSDVSAKNMRAGEFLQPTAPGTQFVTEADVNEEIQKTIEETAAGESDPIKTLEPVTAAVETEEAGDVEPPAPDEPRGLAWYLKARAAAQAQIPAPAAASAAAAAKPELLSYAQTAGGGEPQKEPSWLRSGDTTRDSGPAEAAEKASRLRNDSEKKTESALFAYMSGESSPETVPPATASSHRPGGLIVATVLVAACTAAYLTVPREHLHQTVQKLGAEAVHYAHNWLNPQAATPTQVPRSHENFGLAGDEYKLPVAQNIPDATTDPTQIRVIPVVDPTAKKTNAASSNTSTTAADPIPVESSAQNSTDEPAANAQGQNTAQPISAPPIVKVESPVAESAPSVTAARRDPMMPVSAANIRPQPVAATSALKPPAGIPSSLKSQMASMTPDAGGNKPVEAALPSIEPVNLPEATARGLLLQASDLDYPASAKGQMGSVALQVLIARDGSVQDTKFLQGSLAFARAATDSVKQWRFKPYILNGRPVSIQTVLTLNFKPAS